MPISRHGGRYRLASAARQLAAVLAVGAYAVGFVIWPARETPIPAAALRDFGCEEAQGLHYSKAREAEDFLRLPRTRDRLPAAVGA